MRVDGELKRKLEGVRGEPLVDRKSGAEISHHEVSDGSALCRRPTVSVYMLAYNHEKYLQQAIDGVMEQRTDFEYELIIAEDCSTDGTRRICLENQARFPDRIRVLWSEENVGMSQNGARARAACRGEFIAICEGDDYWVNPTKLQKQVDLMRRHPTAGICFGGNDIYYEFNGYYSRYEPSRAPQEFYSGRIFCQKLIFAKGDRGFYLQNLHTSTHLMRRSAMSRARQGFEDVYCWLLKQGDVTMILTIAAVSDICFLGERCSVYRMNDGGVTRSVGARSLMDGDFLKIYISMRVFGWTFDTAFAAFSDLLVIRWVKIALEGDGPAQKVLAKRIGQCESLTAAFGRWYCRGFLRAMAAGALTRQRYRRLRPLYTMGACLNKWKIRSRLNGMA